MSHLQTRRLPNRLTIIMSIIFDSFLLVQFHTAPEIATLSAIMHPGPADNPRQLIEAADSHLYAAKRAGRNRVSAAPEAESREESGAF